MDPVFAMYSGMYDGCAPTAARQQWGSQGIYIPETAYFDGLGTPARRHRGGDAGAVPAAQAVGAAVRALHGVRAPPSILIPAAGTGFRRRELGEGQLGAPRSAARARIGPVNHILGTTAKIAYLFWRRYEYTLDREWLERARLSDAARARSEFYRNLPEPRRRARTAGITSTTSTATRAVWGARDTDEDLSAMRGVLAGGDPRVRDPGRGRGAARCLARVSRQPGAACRPATIRRRCKPADYTRAARLRARAEARGQAGGGLLPDANSLPMWFFDLCNLESRDRALLETAQAHVRRVLRNGLTAQTPVGVLSKMADRRRHRSAARTRCASWCPNQIRALAPERATAYRNGGG